jgi:hypothetical protein
MKVKIEVTGPVQDPKTGEVLIQPGTRYDEGAAELDGLPAHMLRPVLADDDKPADKPAEKSDDKPAAAKPASSKA